MGLYSDFSRICFLILAAFSMFVSLGYVAADDDTHELEIVIYKENKNDNVKVDYLVGERVYAIPLLSFARAFRHENWTLPSEFVLEEHQIYRRDRKAFDKVSISIAPDLGERGGIYPNLTIPNKDEALINISYLMPAFKSSNVRVRFNMPDGISVIDGHCQVLDEVEIANYDFQTAYNLYLMNESDLIRNESVCYRGPKNIVGVDIVRSALRTQKFYSKMLGLPITPFFLSVNVSEIDAELARRRADVDENSFTSIRLRGEPWTWDENKEQGLVLSETISHEIAHIWSARIGIKPQTDKINAWFHEGLAEYMALSHMHEVGEDISTIIEGYIDDCRSDMGKGYIDHKFARNGRSVYACGTLFFWMLDQAGEQTNAFWPMVNIWRADDNVHDVVSAYQRMIKDSAVVKNELLAALKTQSFVNVWPLFSTFLSDQGYSFELQEQLDPRILGRSWLNPMLAQACVRGYGYYTRSDHFELEGVENCEALAHVKILKYVNGVDIFQNPVEARKIVAKACASGHEITIGDKNNAHQVPCDFELVFVPRKVVFH